MKTVHVTWTSAETAAFHEDQGDLILKGLQSKETSLTLSTGMESF